MEKTNIYFIGSTELGAVKIGKSNNPKKRLIELQTGNSHKLTLFAVIEDVSPDYEKELHELMDHIRLNGEWFKLTDELLHFMINKNTTEVVSFKSKSANLDPKELLLRQAINKLIVYSGDCTHFITDAEILMAINQYTAKDSITFDFNEIRETLNSIISQDNRIYSNGEFGYQYYEINYNSFPDF